MQEFRKAFGASDQTSSGVPSTQTPSLFGIPTTTQQPKTGSIFGGTSGAVGTTASQTAMDQSGAIGPQRPARSIFTRDSVFGKPQPAAGTGVSTSDSASAFGPSRCLVATVLLSI